ncbi:hypothetical protein OWV82_024728 [Melia azedarach]|uniref:Uncharacterized protein n=1 Tax=Melia azedarach TaxID=155640 RepID=A0ACC1WQQ7_MELAZ|nr:hypothetical protein OWV82_024728 [Melia azedarach]
MEEIRSSPPLTAARNSATKSNQQKAEMSRIKKDCLFFATSLQEGFQYVKALFIGLQAKKATARNEKEATEADLQTAKMQVEAADSAEETKKRIDKFM